MIIIVDVTFFSFLIIISPAQGDNATNTQAFTKSWIIWGEIIIKKRGHQKSISFYGFSGMVFFALDTFSAIFWGGESWWCLFEEFK